MQTKFQKTLNVCCELFNAGLQERRDAWKLNRKSVNYHAQAIQLPQIKLERPDVEVIYSQVLQDTLRRLGKAFDAFFRRVKAGEKQLGFPRFKPRRRFDSFCYPQSGFKLEGDKLTLSKLGSVRVKLHRLISGKIKTCTIKTEGNKWFVIFTVEGSEREPLPLTGKTAGIDVGLTHFATLSTGEQIPNPRFFRADQDALARAQRNGKRKAARRIHNHIRNRRANFAHQVSRYLVDQFDAIFFEKLNIRGMLKNHRLAKSIADAAWNQLIQYTSYKAENAGRICRTVDPRNTSKLTACCGERVEMTLSDRVIHCPKCQSVTDRDWNASLNILSRGLATLAAA